jgi:L-ascorbate metabolism protein UlaG (beta-lactamase superfamily)
MPYIFKSLPLLSLALLAAAPSSARPGVAELSYLGRSSIRIKTASGFVVYIDPYAPGDYSTPADLVLVSHGHGDHNAVGKTTRKPDAIVLAPAGAVERIPSTSIAEGEVRTVGPVTVRALPAANTNHPRGYGVGYLLSFDGIHLYFSGDTSRLPEMAGWKGYDIDYALLCCDGFYNMGAEEAARSAAEMGAKRIIPIHTSKDGVFDAKVARSVKYGAVTVVEPGATIELAK